MKKRMEERYPEITLGEPICKKLKQLFFPDKPWPECKTDLPKMFTRLKQIARPYYDDELMMLRAVAQWSDDDILEALKK